MFVACDVGDRGQVEALVEKTVEAYGGLDVMISNAAVLHPADILELEEEDFDRVVRVNLKGFFLTGQAAAKRMVAQGRGGVIINMSSIQAYITNANLLAYAVCKGGVKQLTVAMALALAPHGIRVNAIGPGSIATDMVMQLISSDDARRTVMSRTPAGTAGDAGGDRGGGRVPRERRGVVHHRRDGGRGRRAPGAELRGAGRRLIAPARRCGLTKGGQHVRIQPVRSEGRRRGGH